MNGVFPVLSHSSSGWSNVSSWKAEAVLCFRLMARPSRLQEDLLALDLVAGIARFAALSSRVDDLAGEFVSPSSAIPIVRLGPSQNSESMASKASSSMSCPPGKTEGMNDCVPISSYPR